MKLKKNQYVLPSAADVGADPSGTAAAAVTTHEGAPDPHPQYLTQPEGDARYVQPGAAPAGHAASHAPGAADPLTGYVDTSTNQTISGQKTIPAGTNGQWIFNQPPQVAVGTNVNHPVRRDDPRLVTDAAATTASVRTIGTGSLQAAAGDAPAAAVAGHVAASDPHGQYLTNARGDVRYQPVDSDLTAIAALAPADGALMRRISGAWASSTLAQVKTDLALTKGDVGLGNVDNTADSAKPISTLQQAALDTKQPVDPQLTALAGLAPAADQVPYFTGLTTAALATVTSYARSFLDDVDATAARATLGAVSSGDARLTDSRPWSLYTAGGEATGRVPTWNGTAYVPAAPAGGLPSGGASGQGLAKTSSADGAVAWTNMVRVVRPGEDFNGKVASLVPGDVLLVTGRHVVTDALVAVSGSATLPITIIGDGTAVIEHSGGRTGTGYGLTVTGSYLHFADLIVQEAAKGVVVQGVGAQHISFERIIGRRTKNEVFKARDFASYLYFVDCHAEDAGLGGSFGEGFYIGDAATNWPTPNVTPDTTGYVRLERCSTRRTLNDGFDLKEGAHHIVMRDCYTDRVLATIGNSQGDSGMYSRADDVQIINYQVRGAPGDGLKLYDVTVNSTIYGRRMEVLGGLVDGAGGAGVASQSDDLKVYSDFVATTSVVGGRTNVVGGGWTSQYDPATFVEMTWSSPAAFWRTELSQHAASHAIGGTDPLTPAMIGAAPRLRGIRTITTSQTLSPLDDIVLANTGSAALTATLPSAVGIAGEAITLVKTGVNALTIATTGGQTINGATTEVLSVTGGFRNLVSDGANWVIVGGKIDPVIANLADTGAGGTVAINASAAGVYRGRLTGSTASLGVPTQPIDGDVINIELYAVVACVLTINSAIVPTGGLSLTVNLAAGKLWSGALRYRAATSPATSAAAWRLLASSADN